MFATTCTTGCRHRVPFRLVCLRLVYLRLVCLRLVCLPLNSLPLSTIAAERRAGRPFTDGSQYRFHPEIGMKQPVLPGQGEARNILIGAVNRQVASH